MGVIIGVIVGYAFGARAGQDAWSDLTEAWEVISTSEEIRGLLAAGLSASRHLLGQAGDLVGPESGCSPGAAALRPVG